MFEARAFVLDIETAKKVLEDNHAIYKGEYRCRDLIFLPIGQVGSEYVGDKFLRLRIYEKNIWNKKRVVVAIKKTEKKEVGKSSIIYICKEFDSEIEARRYIQDSFGNDFTFDFEFTRTGWQYDLGDDQIDLEKVEDIENCYTIEVKSLTQRGLQQLTRMFNLIFVVKGSMVGAMKRLLDGKTLIN